MKKEYIDYLKNNLSDDQFENGINLLKKGISPQYIVGNVNFYGNTINVDKRVLIPRFETELLVEKTINYIKNNFNECVKILDIGTGSGCIAISLKKELDSIVWASDISNDALDVARNNAKNNDVDINFVCSDIFDNIDDKFDVIISNPPYIRNDEEIEDIVKNNEPNIALYASNNGLFYYDKILKSVKKYMSDRYIIAFEIGEMQGNDIKKMVKNYLGDVYVSVEKDYSGRDRFLFVINL